MSDMLLTVKDLCFHYTNVDVIHKINFSVERGRFVGIFGDNGAGKSTFIKLLLGQLKPCQGEVHWMGTPIGVFNDWSRIGYVPQRTIMSNEFFPATVQEVVTANLYRDIGMFRRPRKEHKEKVKAALAMVEMQRFLKRQIGKLSGGQMQRIYIARALVNSPDILVLDEPTSGVDQHTVDRLFKTLVHLNRAHQITILMITHEIERAKEYVTDWYTIDSGRMYGKDVSDGADS
ncbi:MAG: metal ABC transporter ATP-binding protein [Eubacteriales bacterium]|nr:metal ABC transporter ATP-binding protein [Eubacteriales bacterium]